MASRAELIVDVVVNNAKAAASLADTGKRVGKFQSGMAKMAAPAAVAGAALVGFAAVAVKSASRTEQAYGGLDAVFGKQSDTVKGWAAQSADSTGLAASEYAEFAAQIGAQLKNAGVPMDQVAGKTDEMIKLGADLAATYGGTTADAVGALSAALRGEADPAERYGLALNQTAVNAQMAADGTSELTGASKNQAKMATILGLATEQAGGAIGQFGRESDSAAGSAQIAAANWENAKSTLGKSLLPVVTAVAQQLAKVAGFVQDNSKAITVLAVVVGGLAAAILIVNGAMAAYNAIMVVAKAVQIAATAAQWAWNAAMLANPIGLIIIGIIALVAIIILLWKKCAWFRNAVLAVWGAIKVAFAAVVTAAKAVGRWFVGGWNGVVAAIRAVVAWVGRIVTTVRAVIAQVAAVFRAGWAAVVAVVRRAIAIVVAVVKAIVAPYVLVFRTIVNTARVVAAKVAAVFRAAFGAMRTIASSVMNAVISFVRRIIAPVVAVAARIRSAFAAAFNALRSLASAVVSALSAAFRRITGPIVAVASRIKSAFSAAFWAISSIAARVGSLIRGVFGSISGAVSTVVNAIQNLIGWLGRIHVPAINLPGMRSAGTASVSASKAPTLRTAAPVSVPRSAGRTRRAGGTAGVVVNVNGALDPDAVARQIERVLSSAQRRRTGVALSQRALGTSGLA